MSNKKRSIKITLITFLLSVVLLATNKGEYWPFSIYPMFSKAGNPWTRAIITDVTSVDENELWESTSLNEIRGSIVEVGDAGVDQIDFSNFVSKTKNWDKKRVLALRTMIGENNFRSDDWMVFKVKGRLIGTDSVFIESVPFLLFKSDTTLFNPSLAEREYFSE